MPRTLRLKIARDYLALLERIGEPKQAIAKLRDIYGAKIGHRPSRSSVYGYVKELRDTER